MTSRSIIVALSLFISIPLVMAQNILVSPRYALVIGNGKYDELGMLANPGNDAVDIAATLKQLGFTVELQVDVGLQAMEDAVVGLGERLGAIPGSIGFFYFAGHGVQSNGTNYLIPSDARIPSESFLRTKALAAQTVLDTLQSAKNGLNIVVLDACRDSPYGWSRSASRGLSVVGSQPTGSIIVYATSAGSVAQDGNGRNGVFTQELLKFLGNPGLDVKEVFNRTGASVMTATGGAQVPAIYSQFFDQAFLSTGTVTPAWLAKAAVLPVGSIEVQVPDGTPVKIAGTGGSWSLTGSGFINHVPAGEYSVTTGNGDSFISDLAQLSVFQGTATRYEPYSSGAIRFSISPRGATCILAPGKSFGTDTAVSGIGVGTYKAIFQKAGYRDLEQEITVSLGRIALIQVNMQLLSPGSLVVTPYGRDLFVYANGQPVFTTPGPGGKLVFDGIPAGVPLDITLKTDYAANPHTIRGIVVGEAEKKNLDIELYRPWLTEALRNERRAIASSLSARRGKTFAGFMSLATGVLGAAATGLVYYLGTEAGKDYDTALDTASTQFARQQVELYGSLFFVTAGISGAGFATSPFLLMGGPDPRILERSIQDLDEKLGELRK